MSDSYLKYYSTYEILLESKLMNEYCMKQAIKRNMYTTKFKNALIKNNTSIDDFLSGIEYGDSYNVSNTNIVPLALDVIFSSKNLLACVEEYRDNYINYDIHRFSIKTIIDHFNNIIDYCNDNQNICKVDN